MVPTTCTHPCCAPDRLFGPPFHPFRAPPHACHIRPSRVSPDFSVPYCTTLGPSQPYLCPPDPITPLRAPRGPICALLPSTVPLSPLLGPSGPNRTSFVFTQ